MTRRAIPMLVTLLLLPAITARAAVRHVVSPDAGFMNQPDGQYLTPQSAAFKVGDAMAVAAAGDTIKVAGAAEVLVYRERITLSAGVVLRGGYSLASPAFSQRDADVFQSELNGAPVGGGSAGTVVIVVAGAGPETVIDGFRITGGGPAFFGGGLRAIGASPTIRDNIFYLNQGGDSQAGGGGAIWLSDGANALIDGNTFATNGSITQSGTVHIADSNPIITNNIFTSAFISFAIFCIGDSEPVIQFNDFFSNGRGDLSGGCDTTLFRQRNLFVDPLLCDPVNGVFSLFDESQVIGAGEGGRTIGAKGGGCHAVVKYVSTAGTPRYPYATPATAASKLSDVLPITAAGDTVRVEAGDYTGHISVPPGVLIEGDWGNNFQGRATSRNASVLIGDGTAPVVTFEPDGGVAAGIDGFVVTGGNGGAGSAILIQNASPVLRSLDVVLNQASSGGVIHVTGGTPEVVNTLVAINRGSGISCAGSAAPDVHHCGFFRNTGGPRSGCPGTLPPSVLTADPLFCNVSRCDETLDGFDCSYNQAGADFRLFAESPYRSAADDGSQIGILRVNCNKTIHYVLPGGLAQFPYTTPQNAAQTVAQALAVATVGDTVRVGPGTYTETIDMPDGIRLEGGWSANFTTRSPVANESLLLGNVDGMPTVRSDGNDFDASIDGFTISHADGIKGPGVLITGRSQALISGNVITGNTTSEDGAGIILIDSNPTVHNNTVFRNTTTSSNSERAGGILLKDLPNVVPFASVRQNLIYDNFGGYGAVCQGSTSRGVGNDVRVNLMFENDGVPGGSFDPDEFACNDGAMRNGNLIDDPIFCDVESGELTIRFDSPAVISAGADTVIGARPVGCVASPHTFFVDRGNNRALFPYGSGPTAAPDLSSVFELASSGDTIKIASAVYAMDRDPVELTNGIVVLGNFNASFTSRSRTTVTTLTGNRNDRIFFAGSDIDSSTIIDGFRFSDGRAEFGGGVFIGPGASPIIRNVEFRAMAADSAGAAIYCSPGSTPKIRNCLFFRNFVPNPLTPTIVIDQSNPELASNTFFENLKLAIDVRSGSPDIFNNIVMRNGEGGIRCAKGATPTIDHNLVFSNSAFNFQCPTPPDVSNVSANPLFCDEVGNNFSVFDHSPAARAGRNGSDIGAFGVGCVTSAHFVSTQGDTAYPYSRPRRVSRSIQAALDVAARRENRTIPGAPPSDTVYVAGGVYNEDLVVPPNVVLLGGYPLNFGVIDTNSVFANTPRDFEKYPVIVRGSGKGSVVTVAGRGPDDQTSRVVLDGIAIRGGEADLGGAVFVEPDAQLTLSNVAADSSIATLAGGAVYVSPVNRANVQPRFEFFSAVGNSAPSGAAVYSDSTNAEWHNCTFVGNEAAAGGVLELGTQTSSGEVARCIFSGNIGTAMKMGSARVFDVRDNLFWENTPGDTMLPFTLDATNAFSDPRFCDAAVGDWRIYYDSPAVLSACARLAQQEVIGRFAVGCTDPGHTFLVGAGARTPAFPFTCVATKGALIGNALSRANAGDSIRVQGSGGNGLFYRENLVMGSSVVLSGGWDAGFTAASPIGNRTTLNPLSAGAPILTVRSPRDFNDVVIDSLRIDTTAVITGFTFREGNAQLGNGGAILCLDASPRIQGNVFRQNVSLNFGGAVCAIGSRNQAIRRNTFFTNRAAHGGAIYLGECESPIVTENLIYSNQGDLRGAGIRLARHSGAALIRDNTISGNLGEGISFAGGSSGTEIYNNIVSFNTREGVELSPASGVQLIPHLHDNLYWANTGGNFGAVESGEGDIFLNPLFCARLASDYNLQACSPALNAGADTIDTVIGHRTPADSVCRDIRAPQVTIAFLKNSIAPRFLDVYVDFSELVIDSSLSINRTCENEPSISLDVVRVDTTGTLYGVTGLETSGCGDLKIIATASDRCSNVALASRSVSTAIVAPGAAAALRLVAADAEARVTVTESAAHDEVLLFLATSPSSAPIADDPALALLGRTVGEPFEVAGPSQLAGSEVTLRLKASAGVPAEASSGLALYRQDRSGWVRVESWIDPADGALIAHPDEDGLFQLVLTAQQDASATLPTRLALHQNSPNPAPGQTSIAFDLPARGMATLRVYDVSGRRVTTLVDRALPPGRHAFTWAGLDHTGRRVPSGVYFYELRTARGSEVRKLVLVR